MAFPFEIKATEGKARTGVLKSPRGDIRTPAFMPVGTAATVKAMLGLGDRAKSIDLFEALMRGEPKTDVDFISINDF